VWYICLHLVDSYDKCRSIYHTWILWDLSLSLLTKAFSWLHIVCTDIVIRTGDDRDEKVMAGGVGAEDGRG